MKLLGKIIVILVAALMVAGATLALDNSGALSSLTSRGRGERCLLYTSPSPRD